MVRFWSSSATGRERNEYKLASPAAHNTRNSARHKRNNLFCALSPDTIPHFAENNQIPYAKCHEAATSPTT